MDRDHLQGLCMDEKMILKRILTKYAWRALSEFLWLCIGRTDGILWTWEQTFRFHKMWDIHNKRDSAVLLCFSCHSLSVLTSARWEITVHVILEKSGGRYTESEYKCLSNVWFQYPQWTYQQIR
jgi:hypothetical protein